MYSHIVFQHLPRKSYVERYFREAARVLKPGGLLRVQVDGRSRQFFRRWVADSWSGVVFSARELARRLERAGFRGHRDPGRGDPVSPGDGRASGARGRLTAGGGGYFDPKLPPKLAQLGLRRVLPRGRVPRPRRSGRGADPACPPRSRGARGPRARAGRSRRSVRKTVAREAGRAEGRRQRGAVVEELVAPAVEGAVQAEAVAPGVLLGGRRPPVVRRA